MPRKKTTPKPEQAKTKRFNPSQSQSPPALIQKKKTPLFLKLLLALIIFLIIIIGPPLLAITWYTTSFTQAAGISNQQLISTLRLGFSSSIDSQQNKTNILVLGTDEISGQKDGSLLTDTNIVISYNHYSKQITLLSIPRDLWIDAFKTKINAIYYYGEISEDTTGLEFTADVISQIIGQPIHYHTVLNLDSLGEIIDSLGGIDLDVPQTFSDDKFPLPDVDVTTVTDPQLLYETITFEKGLQHFDGTTALKYIRSRQSDNQIEGTDLARSKRQQQLISAIINKLKSPDIIKNPHLLGNVYKTFRASVDTDLSDQNLVTLARINGRQLPSINTLSLPVQENGDTGLIFNPPVYKYRQWVYEPLDPTWQAINDFVNDNL